MFSNDTMIYPKETAWFHQLQADGTILDVKDTEFYQKDFIGLRSLNEAGRVTFTEWEGEHLQFSYAQIENVLAPFLK